MHLGRTPPSKSVASTVRLSDDRNAPAAARRDRNRGRVWSKSAGELHVLRSLLWKRNGESVLSVCLYTFTKKSHERRISPNVASLSKAPSLWVSARLFTRTGEDATVVWAVRCWDSHLGRSLCISAFPGPGVAAGPARFSFFGGGRGKPKKRIGVESKKCQLWRLGSCDSIEKPQFSAWATKAVVFSLSDRRHLRMPFYSWIEDMAHRNIQARGVSTGTVAPFRAIWAMAGHRQVRAVKRWFFWTGICSLPEDEKTSPKFLMLGWRPLFSLSSWRPGLWPPDLHPILVAAGAEQAWEATEDQAGAAQRHPGESA